MKKSDKNAMIKTAEQLGYMDYVIEKLRSCDDEAEALRIMKEARLSDERKEVEE